MYILGINAYHGDSSACIIKDGVLLAAIEEERIRRVKHWAGLPTESIKFCLAFVGVGLHEVDFIAIAKDPRAHIFEKIKFALFHHPSLKILIDRFKSFAKSGGIIKELSKEFSVPEIALHKKLLRVEHHKAHIGSSFFVSPFENAAVVTFDGLGDFVSTMWGTGLKNKIHITGEIIYPHSLGFFYTAITQYLGFWNYGDEYKVMGLSALGKPTYKEKLKEVLLIDEKNGTFQLNLDYFIHQKGESTMTWENCAPVIPRMFSKKLETLLGPTRGKEEPLNERFQNIAASVQSLYEDAFFALLNRVQRETGEKTICLAGGTIQNSLANGLIFKRTLFTDVYIPPAAHDAGLSIGAAFYAWYELLGNVRDIQKSFIMQESYWGPEYTRDEFKKNIDDLLTKEKELLIRELSYDQIITETAKLIADGNIVGWFQGRTEWGPRALGNRSILANPAFPEMKEILNTKIKKRELFRPFAPSIIEEAVSQYFEGSYPVPFMEKVYMIRKDKQAKIPAVVHLDGTGRLQSVNKQWNPLYWELINAVGGHTGVPIVLNTSFNENEPIVNKPEEAIYCFLRTKMDVLVLGNFLVTRKGQ